MFDLSWRKPEPLVPRRWRLEVGERIAADGSVLEPLDIEAVVEAGRALVGSGIESIAICFLNSYVNPVHEGRRPPRRLAEDAFRAFSVTASVDVLPSMGEYERCSTTVVNAYGSSQPYAAISGDLGEGLRGSRHRRAALDRQFQWRPIDSRSGAGKTRFLHHLGPRFRRADGRGARLGTSIGTVDLIAFDMGGTTASAATMVRTGDVSRTHEYEFRDGISTPSRFTKAGGYMMRVPTVDVAEVGSWRGLDPPRSTKTALLPRRAAMSAGAMPGPACYGLGGDRPTVTDANVAAWPLAEGDALAAARCISTATQRGGDRAPHRRAPPVSA